MSKTIDFIRDHASETKDGEYYLQLSVEETLSLWSAASDDERALKEALLLLKNIHSVTDDGITLQEESRETYPLIWQTIDRLSEGLTP